MLWVLFYLIVIFFLSGAGAIIRLNRTSDPEQQKARWIKYVFYLLVVSLTTLAVRYGLFYHLTMLIVAIGGYEITRGWLNSSRSYSFLLLSVLIYLCIALAFSQFAKELSIERILYVYTIVFTFDGFSQIIGQLFGKKKIMPNISPEKTIGGVIGGYIMGVSTGLFIIRFLGSVGGIMWLSPFLICTGAFIGDALASLYKRKCKMKDYSNLIPGHGGVLDRYDSLIFAGAFFWLLYN